jgi:protein-disulfide isomerase
MRVRLTYLLVALALWGCGAKSRTRGGSREAVAATGVVDLDKLTTAETLLLMDIVDTEASPCAEDLSLLESLEREDPCDASLRALGFIYRRILEGYGREDVLDQYVARFKQAEVVDLDLEGVPDTGPADAEVVITVFSDFQCPYCRKAAAVVREVEAAHPDEVRVLFKHFPLPSIHPDSMNAALAAAAAHMQGRFWQMHDALFALEGDLDASSLERAAQSAGLDMERWREDLESPDALDIVNRDLEQAQELSLSGTPTLFVDGMMYTEPLKYLEKVVEGRIASSP